MVALKETGKPLAVPAHDNPCLPSPLTASLREAAWGRPDIPPDRSTSLSNSFSVDLSFVKFDSGSLS